jgi:hypothetical protein
MVVVLTALVATVAGADDKSPCPGPDCVAVTDAWFANEVWAKVGVMECIKCHKQGGDAEDSRLVLLELGLAKDAERKKLMALNRDAVARVTHVKSVDQALLLIKVAGGLDHGGKQVLKTGSTGYRILEQIVRRVNSPAATLPQTPLIDPDAPPFFDGVLMVDDLRLLRRATLSLAGRLPTTITL